ncbi:hypothetical protein ANN_27477 [Periplaneta americana]|uniref:C2H2-type domain-containing protein n=1 Tax=Periplaneta americana TaxID=6978 RepID=A0ABQ8RVZ2_PERAM|nr:hypothetical protein ANN_27477 [Periplaneta americana]
MCGSKTFILCYVGSKEQVVLEDVFDLDRVKQEQKVEVSSDEDEVFPESIVDNVDNRVSQECANIHLEENKLTQCSSNRLDASSTISDIKCKSLKCDICNEDFLTPQSLKLHFRIHTIKNSFECDVCGKCFLKLSDKKKHVRLHKGGIQFHCDVCGKSFSSSSNFKRHVRIHTGERPFKCDVCGKCFSDSSVLNKHARIHTGERPFRCDVCGNCFADLANFYKHARVHTGESPFRCQDCGKCFSQSSVLRRHARIHTGERPFKCLICGKSFSQLGYLKNHVRTHTGEKPFKCEVCAKSFSQLAHLRSHLRIHTGEKPFQCEITVHVTAESRPNSHSADCAPSIMAVDIGHIRQHICVTWSQATKGNIEGGEFDPVLWIEFGLAQWSERLTEVDNVRRTGSGGGKPAKITAVDELVLEH